MYRISEAGIAVLKQGADPSVESNWNLVLSFTGETATASPEVRIGPSSSPAIVTKDMTTGAPRLNLIDPNGQNLPLLRTHAGVVAVPSPTKDIRIMYGITFLKVPRISILLNQVVTSFPYRVSETKTYADVRFQNNYGGDGFEISWTAVEPV